MEGLNIVKFDYKLLLLWHLNQISKISSRYMEREVGGAIVDPDKEYKRSIITLQAYLTPYIDKEYKEAAKKYSEKKEKMNFLDWADLLGELICLLDRKQWLIIEDVIAEDDDNEEPVGDVE